MKLGINLLFLEPGRVGGSETFAREILNFIDKDYARRNKVYLYCTKSFAGTVKYNNIKVKICLTGGKNKIKRLMFEQLVLPFRLFVDRIELLHSMGYSSPLITHCKKIVTIFDTQYKTVPYTVDIATRVLYSIMMPLIASTNSLIITSSQFSKREINKNLYCPMSKIKVIRGGVPAVKERPTPYSSRGNYIMSSSATHPHKNIINVIKSFNIVQKNPKFKDIKLYITGFPAKGHKELLATISTQGLKDKVIF